MPEYGRIDRIYNIVVLTNCCSNKEVWDAQDM